MALEVTRDPATVVSTSNRLNATGSAHRPGDDVSMPIAAAIGKRLGYIAEQLDEAMIGMPSATQFMVS